MAAPIKKHIVLFLSIISIIPRYLECEELLFTLDPEEIAPVLEKSCFLGANVQASHDVIEVIKQLTIVYMNETLVTVGLVNFNNFIWPNGQTLRIDGTNCKNSILSKELECDGEFPNLVLFPKKEIDRSCLLSPAHLNFYPAGMIVSQSEPLEALIYLINSKCNTFRKPNGDLLPAGHHRQYILENLFSVDQISDINMNILHSSNTSLLNKNVELESQHLGVCENEKCGDEHQKNKYSSGSNSLTADVEMPRCDYIEHSELNEEKFFIEYLKKSRPFIIKNGIENWTAYNRWTQKYLREQYGNKTVHVKLTPGGDFEGVENVELWENYQEFVIPDEVKRKLPFPDLVVVRPAGVNMKFSDFLDLITWAAQQPSRNVSAYLEYSSIPEYMPELLEDLSEFDFVKDKLKLRHMNMWLSDGNTLGRLHFDPYDNFLCQLRGKKQVILFEPFDNSKLYESHIPQATLSYNNTDRSFRRQNLEESTSMVMSPVDLLNPHFERFPLFGQAKPLNCTIDEGEVLFMPSFWWHEVYSWPNTQEKRNMAVNFWYEPFLTKEFPCRECKMGVNPMYNHLL